MSRFDLLITVAAIAVSSGCRAAAPAPAELPAVPAHLLQGPSPAVRALHSAELRWKARTPEAYEMSVDVRCFCMEVAKAPPRFRVLRGTPTLVGTLSPRELLFYGEYNTVEKLFAAIFRSITAGQHSIAVSYDPELGYPLVARLDPRAIVADDELFFQVVDFRLVTPQSRFR